jgi:hypothetical protein
MCGGASWQGPTTEQGPAQLSMYNYAPLNVFGHLLQACHVCACSHTLQIRIQQHALQLWAILVRVGLGTLRPLPALEKWAEAHAVNIRRGIPWLGYHHYGLCRVCYAAAGRCMAHSTQPGHICCCLRGSYIGHQETVAAAHQDHVSHSNRRV